MPSIDARKRRRACAACHVLKIRCEPSIIEPLSGCDRCWRLGKECVPAASRRQRDRIADLEAQVAALTLALQAQGDSQQGGVTGSEKSNGSPDSQNNLSTTEETSVMEDDAQTKSHVALVALDESIPIALQQEALDFYVREIFPIMPIVSTQGLDLAAFRADKPILLLSIITFATGSLLEDESRYNLVETLMHIFAFNLFAGGTKSLELIQAIQVASLWYRSRPRCKHATVYQLTQLAASEAIDLGIAGPLAKRSPASMDGFKAIDNCFSSAARKIWLSSFLLTSSLSVTMRRPDANVWTSYHEDCILHLHSSPIPSPEDRLFSHLVHAEKLYHRIARCLGLYEPTSVLDLASAQTKYLIAKLETEITDWAAQAQNESHHNVLRFCQHVALAYLNEAVLHTATNKLSFAVPDFLKQIMPADFARPAVTSEHITALYSLKNACQDALEVATEMEPSTVLALSPLCYIPRMLYSLFVLIKLYVAVTAPGNTYGSVMDKGELHLDYYFRKLEVLAGSLQAEDPTSFNSQIIAASRLLEAWYKDYNAVLAKFHIDQCTNTTNELLLGVMDVAYEETVVSAGLHTNMLSQENLILEMANAQGWVANYSSNLGLA